MYTCPNAKGRISMWEELMENQISNPWVCTWDFNCTLEDGERSTPGGTSRRFTEWKNARNLIDIGFIGPKYTWNHGADAATRRSGAYAMLIGEDSSLKQL